MSEGVAAHERVGQSPRSVSHSPRHSPRSLASRAGANYGATAPQSGGTHLGGEQQKLLSSSLADAGINAVRVEVGNFKDMAVRIRDGPLSIRILSYVGGILLVVTAFLAFLGHFLSLSPVGGLVDVYLFVFGWVVVFLEARSAVLPKQVTEKITEYAKFLTIIWGRGAFYLFVGTLAVAQWTVLSILVGIYMMVLGGSMIYYGYSVTEKLGNARRLIKDKGALRAHFERYDTDKSGALSPPELAKFAQELGSGLTPGELESAILMLDKDRDGAVQFEEFYNWWLGHADLSWPDQLPV